jgi:hypothetical protein
MTLRDISSIGSTVLLALAIVSSVSVSARLYKDGKELEKAQAAEIMSSTVACIGVDPALIP